MNTAQEYPTSLFPINLRKPGKPTQRQKKALLKHYDGGGKRRRKWEMALAQYFPCEAAIPLTIEGGGPQADKSPRTCKEGKRRRYRSSPSRRKTENRCFSSVHLREIIDRECMRSALSRVDKYQL